MDMGVWCEVQAGGIEGMDENRRLGDIPEFFCSAYVINMAMGDKDLPDLQAAS